MKYPPMPTPTPKNFEIIVRAFKNRIAYLNRNAGKKAVRGETAALAREIGANRTTLRAHLRRSEHHKLTALQAWQISEYLKFDGFTYLNDPQIHHLDFDSLWDDVIATRKARQRPQSTIKSIHPRTLSRYESDRAYCHANLTLEDLCALVQELGIAGLTFRRMEYRNAEPRVVGLEHSIMRVNKTTGASECWTGVTVEEAPPLPSTLAEELFIHKSLRDYIRPLQYATPDQTDPTNQPGILHRTLGDLLTILRTERERRGLSVRDVARAAGLDGKDSTLQMWEYGRVLFTLGEARFDLMMGDLCAWADALGFGRVGVPCIGYDLDVAREVLYQTTRQRGGVLGVDYNAGLFGHNQPKRVKDLTYAEPYEHNKVMKIPALLFERWLYWGFADGLAFEHSKPEPKIILTTQVQTLAQRMGTDSRSGVSGGGHTTGDDHNNDYDPLGERAPTYLGFTPDEAARCVRILRREYAKQAAAVRAVRTRYDRYGRLRERMEGREMADAYRPREAVANDGRIIYPIDADLSWSKARHMRSEK